MVIVAVPIRPALSIALSPQRLQKANACRSEADRLRRLAAGVALDACLRTVGLREFTVTVAEDAHGKPYLPEHPNLHFSLSHSGEFAVCALDDAPIGVDVERIRPVDADRFVGRCYGVQAGMLPKTFFEAWTRQESYVKAVGIGLAGLRREPESTWQFYRLPLDGYVLTVCSEKQGINPSLSVLSGDGSVPPR